eukprot:scaffold23179_cov142-Isochrysis_galbana.AAC.5
MRGGCRRATAQDAIVRTAQRAPHKGAYSSLPRGAALSRCNRSSSSRSSTAGTPSSPEAAMQE